MKITSHFLRLLFTILTKKEQFFNIHLIFNNLIKYKRQFINFLKNIYKIVLKVKFILGFLLLVVFGI